MRIGGRLFTSALNDMNMGRRILERREKHKGFEGFALLEFYAGDVPAPANVTSLVPICRDFECPDCSVRTIACDLVIHIGVALNLL